MFNPSDSLPSRRRFLTGGAAAIMGGAAIGTSARQALAKAPMSNAQAPAFYRFKLGAFEATVVSDGPLQMGEPTADIFTATPKDEIVRTLADNLLPVDNVTLEQNVLVINTGERLVLFDTGLGTTKMMGPDSGRLLVSLKAAGIDAKDIDAVVLTHAHPDHCWALMADNGTRTFPNAQIYMAQPDLDFWTDEGKLSNAMIKPMIEGARKHLLPNRDRIVFVKDGQEVLPGILAMAAPGHTVGHTIYLITSEGKTLCNAGDIAHHFVISVESPRKQFVYDTDGALGVASRLRVFDMLAASRTAFIAYHFPWPGLGYLGRRGDAYHYFAAPLRMVL
jgi:glyoxylase-like metal-dependent hydrolase (beta-lactamase superfamily II)